MEKSKEREVEFVEKVDNIISADVSKDYGSNGLAPKLEYLLRICTRKQK